MTEYVNERGQLVIDDRNRPRQVPTLQNIREGLLTVFYTNPPECQWTDEARWLQDYLMLPAGEDAGARRERLVAALDSVAYDPTLMQTIRHYVREQFGEWEPGTLTAVHDWLVASHGFTAKTAWEVKAPELLNLLKKASVSPAHAKVKGKRHVTAEEANEAMMRAIETEPDRLKWSARDWQRYIGCSTSTIHKTEMWRQGARARERKKLERMQNRNRGRRRPRHYHQD